MPREAINHARDWGAKKTMNITLNITLKVDNQTLNATLTDSPASRDFLALLPLTLTLEDYVETEKIAYLPKKLSTTGAQTEREGRAGAITYYAPWGNLALFHKDFRYSSGLIKLGQFDGSIEALRKPGKLEVSIERVN
jgi:hypothetical protein